MLPRFLVLRLIQIAVFFSYAFSQNNGAELKPACESKIYCDGDFLKEVQLIGIYPDSKDFVDMKLLYDEIDILSNFTRLKNAKNGQNLTAEDLRKFVNENMAEGNELENWYPSDFISEPPILKNICDSKYKGWVRGLNSLWNTLGKKVRKEVDDFPHRYSLLYTPNGFIIPGGRFKELYYWDTYWIVKGLLASGMNETVRGIIDNIVYLVRKFTFMPNGARKYYQMRTQPPMLIPMVESYYRQTKNVTYLKSIIDVLDTEFSFWTNNRTIKVLKDGKNYTMYRYCAPSKGPRPESYREDYNIAQSLGAEMRDDFYLGIKSGAESGWDFSTRWVITNDRDRSSDLRNIQTQNIVPVDLNSILHMNARMLSTLYTETENTAAANRYKRVAEDLLKNIQEVMWNEKNGVWFDWDLKNNKQREYFYLSNVVPLWTESYKLSNRDSIAGKVIGYLKAQSVINDNSSLIYHGTPTSMYNSNRPNGKAELQWDFPNAWPPLQAFLVQGLDKTLNVEAQQLAQNLASNWLRTNYIGYAANGEKKPMYEKYDVNKPGTTGDGGEYEPQTGFGWTNGVVFEFMNRWGNVSDSNDSLQ